MFLLRQQLKSVFLYYRNLKFALVDVLFGLSSLFLNPYRACRKYFARIDQEGVYGEIPFVEFEKLMKAVFLKSNDVYVELGSGRGKTCFWASCFYDCLVIGIELVPSFVRLGKLITFFTGSSIIFLKKSIFEVDLSQATVVYLSSIHFSEKEVKFLEDVFLKMPKKARLVTLSEPFICSSFSLIGSLPISFAWGKTRAFIHHKI